MKIGLVCPYAWDVPGGVSAHIRGLAQELMARGHDISVLSPAENDSGLPDYVVPAGRPVAIRYNGSVARLTFGVRPALRVRRWLAQNEFDVVHVHEPAAPSVSVLTCWAADGPLVATLHTANPRSRTMSAAYAGLQTALEKIDARIAVSEAARITAVSHLGGDAVIIPNGVNVAAYRDAPRLPGYPRSGLTIGFLGRIDEPRKGFGVLLAALPQVIAAHPDVHVLVAGPGDADQALAGMPADLRAYLRVLGRVPQDVKASMLASLDVYVAPNTGGESFGIVLLEAMAAGAPVLASDLTAFRLVLTTSAGELCGETFVNEDADDLAKRLIVLLGDANLRQHLASAASERVRVFDWGLVTDRILDVYETVVRPGRPVRADLSGQAFGRFSRFIDPDEVADGLRQVLRRDNG